MSPDPDDHAFDRILQAARAGDPRSARWLWDHYAGQVAGFLTARGTPEVDEVVNDVFLAALSGLDRFVGGEADFRAWLYGIARNKRIDQLRRLGRRVDGAGVVPERPGAIDVEAEVVDRITDQELRGMLQVLTVEQRDVVVLRFIAGLSLEQAAVALGKPVGAVKALQHRALTQLRKKIAVDPYPEHAVPTI